MAPMLPNDQVERPPDAARSAARVHNQSRTRAAADYRSRSAPTKVRPTRVDSRYGAHGVWTSTSLMRPEAPDLMTTSDLRHLK